MKRTFMIGVAAGALLAGVNLAAAQGAMERQQLPGASGGANIEQKGAVKKKGGEVKAQEELKGGTEVKGKRAQGEIKGGAEMKGGKARAQAGGEMKAQEMQKPGGETKGKAAQPKAGTSTQDMKAGGAAQGDVKAGGSAAAPAGSATTTGQAGTGAKASLTTEQKTQIRETVFKSGPRVTNINFSLSVGTVVPRTVRFAPLPLVLVEIYPQWRGYDYFIYEEEIIIIEPRTLKIVAVIVV